MADPQVATDPAVTHAASALDFVRDALTPSADAKPPLSERTEIDAWLQNDGESLSVYRWHSEHHPGLPVRLTLNWSEQMHEAGCANDDHDVWLDDDQAIRLALALLRAIPKPSRAVLLARARLARATEPRHMEDHHAE